MKKWIFPLVAVLVAGCGNVTWFPDATSTNSSQSSSSGSSNNGSDGSSSTTTTSFASKCGVAASTVIVSNPIVVSGLSGLANISISGADSRYSINGASFTDATGYVGNGASVTVEQSSAAAGASSTVTTTTLNIGGTDYPFQTDISACKP